MNCLALFMVFHLASCGSVDLNEQGHHQKRRFKVLALSHLHIGSGRSLGRWEYFFNSDGERLAFLDYEKLAAEAVKNEELIEKLANAASCDPGGSLEKFLAEWERDDPGLKARISCASGQRILSSQMQEAAFQARSIRNLRLFVGSPDCYLPGSSIKGAVRTAFLASRIESSKHKNEIFCRRKESDDFTNCRALRESLNGTFKANSEQTRLFENLILRDSSKIPYSSMSIACISLYGSAKPRKRQGTNLRAAQGAGSFSDGDEYAEVLQAGSQFEFELVLRTCRSSKLPIEEPEDLLEAADAFYRRIWQQERLNQEILAEQKKGQPEILDFYKSSLLSNSDGKEPGSYLLRVGYGSGQMSQSVFLPYKDHFAAEYGQASDSPLRHAQLYRKNPKLKERQPYPYTARSALAASSERWLPMGWLLLQKI